MDSSPKSAVVSLSSGLDSSVALWMAHQQGIEIRKALTFDYGQLAADQEIAHSQRLCQKLGISHERVHLDWFSKLQNTGALLNKRDLPTPKRSELSDSKICEQTAKAVWVPNRNGVFLEIAACWAEDLGCDSVIVGFNREEAATFADNSEGYLRAINQSLKFSTSNQVSVFSPTAHLDKQEIVHWACENNFPFELVWSCYRNQNEMCGECESCGRLKRALSANGFKTESHFANASL